MALPISIPSAAIKSVVSALEASATVEPKCLVHDAFEVAGYLKAKMLQSPLKAADPTRSTVVPPGTHLGVAASLKALLPENKTDVVGAINWQQLLQQFLPIILEILSGLIPAAPAPAPAS